MKRSPLPRRKSRLGAGKVDRQWPITRESIIRRDKGECQRCHFAGAHVHHVLPRSRGGKNDGSTPLILLCFRCHEYVHNHPAESREKGWLL